MTGLEWTHKCSKRNSVINIQDFLARNASGRASIALRRSAKAVPACRRWIGKHFFLLLGCPTEKRSKSGCVRAVRGCSAVRLLIWPLISILSSVAEVSCFPLFFLICLMLHQASSMSRPSFADTCVGKWVFLSKKLTAAFTNVLSSTWKLTLHQVLVARKI